MDLAELTSRQRARKFERDASDVHEIELRLILNDPPRDSWAFVPLIFRGRVVGELSLNLSQMHRVAVSYGDEHHRAAKHIAQIGGKLIQENAADDWLRDLYWNEQVDEWVGFDTERLCRLLEHWRSGRAVLRLQSVQWLLKQFLYRPEDVTKVAKAIERGLRSKVIYFPNKRGRRRVTVNDAQLDQARRYAQTVQAATKDFKKRHASRAARRRALESTLQKLMPNRAATEVQKCATEWLDLPPREIGREAASLQFCLAKRRI